MDTAESLRRKAHVVDMNATADRVAAMQSRTDDYVEPRTVRHRKLPVFNPRDASEYLKKTKAIRDGYTYWCGNCHQELDGISAFCPSCGCRITRYPEAWS